MRKIIMLILAVLGAIAVYFQDALGISINAGQAVAALAVIGVYLYGEAKNDFARFKTALFQEKKWIDPAFWVGLFGALLPVINSEFGLNIPVELVLAVLAALLGLIFKKRQAAIDVDG